MNRRSFLITLTLALLSITFVLRQLGRPREAAVLYGTFEELSRLHGLRPPAGLAMLMGQEGLPSITLPVDLGEAAYVEALAEGARLTGFRPSTQPTARSPAI